MVFFWLCLRQFRALARAVPPGPRLSGEGAKGAAKNTVEQSMRTIPDKIVFDLPNATRRFWSALRANTRRRQSRGVPSVRAPYTPGILRPLVLPDCWKGVPRCWRGKLGLVGRGECSSLEHQEAGSWRSNNPHPPQQLTSPLPRLRPPPPRNNADKAGRCGFYEKKLNSPNESSGRPQHCFGGMGGQGPR